MASGAEEAAGGLGRRSCGTAWAECRSHTQHGVGVVMVLGPESPRGEGELCRPPQTRLRPSPRTPAWPRDRHHTHARPHTVALDQPAKPRALGTAPAYQLALLELAV